MQMHSIVMPSFNLQFYTSMEGLKWIIIVLQLGWVSANLKDILINQTSDKFEGLTRNIKMMTLYDDFKNLAADIIGKTKSSHCYAMITDSIYREEIYQEKIFNSIIGKSVFMVSEIWFLNKFVDSKNH